ncbi:MAG: DUF5615 family PIN-like protein [Burkholderiales bacterium]|nr:DUF5615 family PIN-like protein [Phycisphaerae bacterium]
MKFLADENLDAEIVYWLRDQGNDVIWVAESATQTSDDALLSLATAEQRIVITSDLDFGELIFRQKRSATGILLLRLRNATQHEKLAILKAHWAIVISRLIGHFVVVSNQKVRIRPLSL